MKVGGFIKSSMIDYPGKISCVVFTNGCNFICPYCHNSELIPFVDDKTDTGIDTADVFRFLEKRRGLLDGLVITGGEPTFQKELVPFCKRVKDTGYLIKLDTNGSRPDILMELIENNLVDYFAMDIKADPSKYVPLLASKNYSEEIRESLQLIIGSGVKHEFRTTCAKPFVSRQMIRSVCELINGADCYALQPFNPVSVLDPEFFETHGEGIDKEEIAEFQKIALAYVKKCIIR